MPVPADHVPPVEMVSGHCRSHVSALLETQQVNAPVHDLERSPTGNMIAVPLSGLGSCHDDAQIRSRHDTEHGELDHNISCPPNSQRETDSGACPGWIADTKKKLPRSLMP